MKKIETEVKDLIELARVHARSDGAGIIPGCQKRLAIDFAKEKQKVTEHFTNSVNWTVYWNRAIELIEEHFNE